MEKPTPGRSALSATPPAWANGFGHVVLGVALVAYGAAGLYMAN